MVEKRQKVLFAILAVLVVVFLARMLMGGGGGGGGGESASTGRDQDRTEQTSDAGATLGDTPAQSAPTAPADSPGANDAPPTRNPFAPVVGG